MDGMYISFLWHMHQPYYKNTFTGEYLLPWTLLHGTKDYYDMGSMLKDFPGMKQNFNFVPSLLEQLADYEDLYVKQYLEVFRKHPSDLSQDDKVFLLNNFFNANWENMIRPFPRYYELLAKRGFYSPRDGMRKIAGYFSEDELRDLQILFFLAWTDPGFFETYDGLEYLKEKGRRFTEEDKEVLRGVQKDILKGIIPLYRGLASQGIVELSTSAFYHPIVPLLINSESAREAMPGIKLPDVPFAWPGDASRQISDGLELFQQKNGRRPELCGLGGFRQRRGPRAYMEQGIRGLRRMRTFSSTLEMDARRANRLCHQSGCCTSLSLTKERSGNNGRLSGSIPFGSHFISLLPSGREGCSRMSEQAQSDRKSIGNTIARPLVTIAMDGEMPGRATKTDGRDFLSISKRASFTTQVCARYHLESLDGKDYGSLYHCMRIRISQNFSSDPPQRRQCACRLLPQARTASRPEPRTHKRTGLESI